MTTSTGTTSTLVRTLSQRASLTVKVFAFEALFSWLVASPWMETLSSLVRHHPDGERAFIEQAGLIDLVDLVTQNSRTWQTLFVSSLWSLLIWSLCTPLLQVFVVGHTVDDLTKDETRRSVFKASFRLLITQVLYWIAAVLVLGLFAMLPGALLYARLEDHPSFWLRTLVPFIPGTLSILACSWMYAGTDIIRARLLMTNLTRKEALDAPFTKFSFTNKQWMFSIPRWFGALGLFFGSLALSVYVQSVFLLVLAHMTCSYFRVWSRMSVIHHAAVLAVQMPASRK